MLAVPPHANSLARPTMDPSPAAAAEPEKPAAAAAGAVGRAPGEAAALEALHALAARSWKKKTLRASGFKMFALGAQ